MKTKQSHKFENDLIYGDILNMLVAIYKTCQVSKEWITNVNDAHIHHRMINSQENRAKYPYFIDSMFNGVPVLRKYQDHENKLKVSEGYASTINAIMKDITLLLWKGKSICVYNEFLDAKEWSKFSVELGRIKQFQRDRQQFHYNVTLTKDELKELDNE